MTSTQQRSELQRQIWQIANDVRGSIDSKKDIEHFAQSVDHDKIAENDYNLSVSSYVEAKDTREVIDIGELNKEIKTTVAKIDQLRMDIDAIVHEIEGANS